MQILFIHMKQFFYKFSPNRELKFEKPGQEMIQHCQMLQNILTF